MTIIGELTERDRERLFFLNLSEETKTRNDWKDFLRFSWNYFSRLGNNSELKGYAYCQPDIIGFIVFKDELKKRVLSILQVHPNFKRMKIGEELVLKTIQDARKSRLRRIDTYLPETNTEQARSFYYHLGFRPSRDDYHMIRTF